MQLLVPGQEASGARHITIGGGVQPRWRNDGRERFYLSPEGKMMAAAKPTRQVDGTYLLAQTVIAATLIVNRNGVRQSVGDGARRVTRSHNFASVRRKNARSPVGFRRAPQSKWLRKRC